MNIASAASLVASHQAVQEDLKAFQSTLKNPSIDLDDRWEAFTLLVENGVLNDIKSYGDGFMYTLEHGSGRELTLYDDFYIERHETTLYTDLFEQIQEEPEIEWSTVLKWKEKVLESGFAGFVYDW